MKFLSSVLSLSVMVAGWLSATAAPSVEIRHTSPHVGNPNVIPKHEIFEMTLAKAVDYGTAANFRDVTLSVDFIPPHGGSVTTIHGFYYYTLPNGRSLWKVRFVPKQVGVWRYNYAWIHLPSNTIETGTATFQVVPSARPGFVRRSTSQPFRWEFANGTPFYPIGVNDDFDLDWGDRTGAFSWVKQQPGYNLSMLRMAGVNAFRMRNKNKFETFCDDDPMVDGNDLFETYLPEMSIAFDERMQLLHELDIRINYDIFGNIYLNEQVPSSLSQEDRNLIDYSINRWGAYVDWWQLNNEQSPTDSWVMQAASYVKQEDPYGHPLSESWGADPVPTFSDIDMNAPHWYESESELLSDQKVAAKAALWRVYGKPVLVGEQGNKIAGGGGAYVPPIINRAWQPNSGLRMRIRAWTAFFRDVSFFFYSHGHTDANGGIYLGPEERRTLQTLRRFSDFVLRSDTVSTPVTVSDSAVLRAYGFRSSAAGIAAAYVHRYNTHLGVAMGKSITLNIPQAGHGYWIDPASGSVVSTMTISGAGSQTVPVPPIQVDLAFLCAPGSLNVQPLARFTITNPQDDGDLDEDGVTDYGPANSAWGAAPLTLTFNASSSTDWDGGALTYAWDLGDLTTQTGPQVTHSYTAKGSYPVTLTVTDSAGDTAIQQFWVYAVTDTHPDVNDPPIFPLLPPRSSWAGQAIHLAVFAYDRELTGNGYVATALDVDSFSAFQLPAGASFEQPPHALPNQPWVLKDFLWVPDFNEAGIFTPVFTATDANGLSDFQSVPISVRRPPLP